MIVKVIGQPILTITGDNYSAVVPVGVFDDNNWPDVQTTLTVMGSISEAQLATNFMARLKTQSDAWKASLTVMATMQGKLASLVGKTL